MRMLFIIVAVVAVVTATALGSGYVLAKSTYAPGAQGQAAVDCERQFRQMDSGQKGYLSFWDFKDGTYGPGGHMGLAPTGSAQSSFASADITPDNMVSVQEFCEWKSNR